MIAMLLAAVVVCTLPVPSLLTQPLGQPAVSASAQMAEMPTTSAPPAETSTMDPPRDWWQQRVESCVAMLSTPMTSTPTADTSTANTLTSSPTTSSPTAGTSTLSPSLDCSQESVADMQMFIQQSKYDLGKLLEEHGGAAGNLNVTMNLNVPEYSGVDPTQLPRAQRRWCPDAVIADYFVFNFKHTDFKTFGRTEHGVLRHKGKEDESVDVYGELYWQPPDFCGLWRHATYRVDRDGFSADVPQDYCRLLSDLRIHCWYPYECPRGRRCQTWSTPMHVLATLPASSSPAPSSLT
ncbi:uncharacterized protein LOC117639029 isoform X2 [Thrips palmi]|uniref:Uncharacterized protein LOC117639029 isoform X2 n=1 Tax=Thrips palmi TaxID=161013 RepID=A0A6P8XTN4_THRPL|nr:uncharacterized protein LOC117639029 isoform X2 [Thrips palmi]